MFHPPPCSQSVFGVNLDNMQCAIDSHGNSVPSIILLLQARLYNQGGLQREGIFRIAAGNDHEEKVRGQLNQGVVPTSMDVHALAGLIKVHVGSHKGCFSSQYCLLPVLVRVATPL